MKYLEVYIPDKTAYLIPIGDVHYEDAGFTKNSEALLIGYLNWVKDNPNARIFLMGDLFNCAGRNTRTSPYNNKTNGYEAMLNLLGPYAGCEKNQNGHWIKKSAGQIIGAIDGNHEARLKDDYDMKLIQHLCLNLGISYCEWSAMVRFRIGKRSDGQRCHQVYNVYFHHTTGGGGTIGGKLNRIEKLSSIVEGVDVICGGHNHLLAAAPMDKFYPADRHICKRRVWYVDCGGYLEWGGYIEQKMLAPTKLGSPRIRFSGERDHRDIHISL